MNHCVQPLSTSMCNIQICRKTPECYITSSHLYYKKQTSVLVNTLLHAYLSGLIRPLINSSMTISPGDVDAMQMYLKQMMHSMSLIQSYRADLPDVQPKKVGELFIQRTADGTIYICYNVRFKGPGKANREARQSWRCSQPAYRKTDSQTGWSGNTKSNTGRKVGE